MATEQPKQPATAPASKPKKKGGWSPDLPPRGFAKLTPEEYIKERLNPEMGYYNKSASKAKNRYLQMRAITVVGGALVPVLVNVEAQYINILTTALSLVVVLFVSLETVYKYREQWTNYRSAEQSLRNEYFLFTSQSGTYTYLNEADAFTLFVDRVEEILEAENAATLRVMTTVTETRTGPTGTARNGAKGDESS